MGTLGAPVGIDKNPEKGTLGGGTGVQGVKIDFLKRGNGVPAPREGVSRLGIRFF